MGIDELGVIFLSVFLWTDNQREKYLIKNDLHVQNIVVKMYKNRYNRYIGGECRVSKRIDQAAGMEG